MSWSPTPGSAPSPGPRSSAHTGIRGTAGAFEYWSHAACVLPIEEWPYYSFRRRAFRARGKRWHQSHESVCAEVLAKLRSEGPLNATQLGGAKNGGAWWDWSDTKIAVEWLLDTGDVICARRTGWRRIYDLPERVLPADLLDADPSDADCLIHLTGVTARALGVVTKADLSDYQRLANFGTGRNSAGLSADDAAVAAGLIPVAIENRTGPADSCLGRSARRSSASGGAGSPGAGRRHRVDPALPVRLADLGPEADQADVRVRPQPRGLRTAAQARPRLLHDAAARRRQAGRPRRPGPRRPDPDRPPAHPGHAPRRRATWPVALLAASAGSAATTSSSGGMQPASR